MRSPEDLALIAAIADDLAAGIWVARAPDGQFVYANRAFEEIMGMGPVVGIGVGEYAQPYGLFGRDGRPYPEERLPFVQALQARSTVVVDDIVIHRRDGRRVYVRATARPMFDAAGAITHVAIAFFDITREAEAEAARSQAEERLRRVVGNAPVVLFSFDRDGRITLVEGSGLQRLQRTPADFLGQSVLDLFPSAPIIAENSRRALAGEAVTYVVELPAGEGSAVYESWLTPLRDAGGEVVGVIGVSTDVTERHRAQMQLVQAERLASVGLLAAGVAHEVNNPLSYIIGNLELIERELGASLPAVSSDMMRSLAEPLHDARQGAERVRAIVADLKVFSRVKEHRPSAVEVEDSLDASLDLAHNEIRHRARLVRDFRPVPRVWGDAGRLGQLFLNLLVNAAHSIPEGEADANEIRVVTRCDPGGWVRVEIADSGAGIPAELQTRIFDPFFTTKSIGGGTGLGLSICHSIVTDLGGRIEVESRPGSGSTFRVLLPAAPPEVDPAPEPPPAPAPSPQRASVLVVDDEPLILKVVATMLGPEHEVTCESRAAAALDRIRSGQRFDAILCDLMMPQVTGIDLYDAVLEIAPAQAKKILFLTGGAFTARARSFLERVENVTLEKPFDAATLLARVRQLLG
ncbi:MAG TPA: PAS domain-containing protein [Polyangiaceae bacterium]